LVVGRWSLVVGRWSLVVGPSRYTPPMKAVCCMSKVMSWQRADKLEEKDPTDELTANS